MSGTTRWSFEPTTEAVWYHGRPIRVLVPPPPAPACWAGVTPKRVSFQTPDEAIELSAFSAMLVPPTAVTHLELEGYDTESASASGTSSFRLWKQPEDPLSPLATT